MQSFVYYLYLHMQYFVYYLTCTCNPLYTIFTCTCNTLYTIFTCACNTLYTIFTCTCNPLYRPTLSFYMFAIGNVGTYTHGRGLSYSHQSHSHLDMQHLGEGRGGYGTQSPALLRSAVPPPSTPSLGYPFTSMTSHPGYQSYMPSSHLFGMSSYGVVQHHGSNPGTPSSRHLPTRERKN